MYKSSARISLHLLPGFEFLKIKSVLYDTDNTPKNVTANLPLDFTSLYSHDEITECPNAVLVGLNYDYIDVVNVNGISRDLAVLENISFLTIS